MLRKTLTWAGCALALLLTVGTLSCFGDTNQAKTYTDEANQALQRGDSEGAKALCDKAIAVGGFGPAYTLRGVLTESEPGGRADAFAYYRKGCALNLQAALDRVSQQYPGTRNAAAFRERGRTYAQYWELTKAASALAQAVALDPDDLSAYGLLGLVQDAMSDGEGVVRTGEAMASATDRILKAHPNDLLARAVRVQMSVARSTPKEQVDADCQLVADHASEDPRAALILVGVLSAAGANKRAVEIADAGLKTATDVHLLASLWDARGNAHIWLGELQAAVTDFAHEVQVFPLLYTGYLSQGIVYEKTGDAARAFGNLNMGVALAPNNGTALNARGRLRERAGAPEAAALDFAEAKRLGYKPE